MPRSEVELFLRLAKKQLKHGEKRDQGLNSALKVELVREVPGLSELDRLLLFRIQETDFSLFEQSVFERMDRSLLYDKK